MEAKLRESQIWLLLIGIILPEFVLTNASRSFTLKIAMLFLQIFKTLLIVI